MLTLTVWEKSSLRNNGTLVAVRPIWNYIIIVVTFKVIWKNS